MKILHLPVLFAAASCGRGVAAAPGAYTSVIFSAREGQILLPLALGIASVALGVTAAPPTVGPYPVTNANFLAPALDGSDPTVWVHYPICSNASCPKFPLISYAHGADGGDIDLLGYAHHFEQLASYGFVVAAPDSCSVGCTDKSKGAPWTSCAEGFSSDGLWAPWFGEQLKAIDWVRNQTANASAPDFFRTIDWSTGVGIAGHSMGGQASSVSAQSACAKQWDIRASALIHPASGTLADGRNTGSAMTVPTAAFTSTGDHLCSPASVAATMKAFNESAAGHVLPSLYRNLVGWSHLEPVMGDLFENPLLATYTAAWFKVYLNNEKAGDTYYDLLYGGGPDSLCQSQPMEECYLLPHGAAA